MPNLDKTGPEGKGPRTGRGLGDCDESIETRRKRQERFLDKLRGGSRRRRRPARDGRGRGRGPGLGRRRRRGRADD